MIWRENELKREKELINIIFSVYICQMNKYKSEGKKEEARIIFILQKVF